GAARDSIEAALDYASTRMQFGKPLTAYQLTQKKLADMTIALNKGQLMALQLGRANDAGTMDLHQISMAKLDNVRVAIDIARKRSEERRVGKECRYRRARDNEKKKKTREIQATGRITSK